MDYKNKALEHVRSVCEELIVEDKYGSAPTYYRSPHLEHWLRGMNEARRAHYLIGSEGDLIEYAGETGIGVGFTVKHVLPHVKYDLSSENQSEEFYKAYCEIVGV